MFARRPLDPVLLILPICCVIEAVLLLSELGWLPVGDLRVIAFDLGAFWPGLLFGYQSFYPTQSIWMFLTYSVLHAGPLHLTVNMLTLMFLTDPVVNRVGVKRFYLVYGVGTLVAALAFAVLSFGAGPMVGASGALFGLVGAILVWEYRDNVRDGLSQQPVLRVAASIIGLNVLLWLASDGALAWQAHLGGAVGGALVAVWMDRRQHPRQH